MMKNYKVLLWGMIVLLCGMMHEPVLADMGPKPSVHVEIQGLEGQEYWATLLAEETSSGPFGTDTISDRKEEMDGKAKLIFEKIQELTKNEEYHFLGFIQNCSENHRFVWGYYPPEKFKVFIYLPQLDQYLISKDVYSRYAFDSYFTVKVKNTELQKGKKNVVIEKESVEKVYDYQKETGNLLVRMTATIVIEILLAILMGFRRKRTLLVILIINLVTQGLLNGALNIIHLTERFQMMEYLVLEGMIVLIEGVTYLKTFGKEQCSKVWIYAVGANLLSFGSGLMMADLLPWLF